MNREQSNQCHDSTSSPHLLLSHGDSCHPLAQVTSSYDKPRERDSDINIHQIDPAAIYRSMWCDGLETGMHFVFKLMQLLDTCLASKRHESSKAQAGKPKTRCDMNIYR